MHKPLLTLSLLALAIQAHAGPIRPVVTATPEAGRYTAVQNVKLNVGSPLFRGLFHHGWFAS